MLLNDALKAKRELPIARLGRVMLFGNSARRILARSSAENLAIVEKMAVPDKVRLEALVGLEQIDSEYRQELRQAAEEGLDEAVARMRGRPRDLAPSG